MSERANGWLLIVGGLAIGLVLWLSPSHVTQRDLASMARHDCNRLLHGVAGRLHADARPAAMIRLIDLSTRMAAHDPPAGE